MGYIEWLGVLIHLFYDTSEIGYGEASELGIDHFITKPESPKTYVSIALFLKHCRVWNERHACALNVHTFSSRNRWLPKRTVYLAAKKCPRFFRGAKSKRSAVSALGIMSSCQNASAFKSKYAPVAKKHAPG